MKTKLFFATLVIASIHLLSCHSAKPGDEQTIQPAKEINASDLDKLSNTKWKLHKMNNDIITDTTITLNFSGMATNAITFYGKSFVNNYGGRFYIKDNKMLTEPGFATKMAAADEKQNELEQKYFNQLNSPVYFTINENELDVYSADSAVLIFGREN